MAKKKQTPVEAPKLGTMRNSTHVDEYKSRYVMDPETGAILPKAVGSTSESMPKLEIERLDNGQIEVYVPALATGCFNNSGLMPNPDDPFGTSVLYSAGGFPDAYPKHRQDGKLDMAKAIYWWRHDPILFKSIRFLCQLANSNIKFSSTSEESKTLVEFWFNQAMPHSFRKGWFLEYFRTGMVPVIKTLVPYIPRDYKPDKIPQTNDGDNVDDMDINAVERVKAVESKTQDVVAKQTAALEEYKKAVAAVEQARIMHSKNLCSAERLLKYQEALAITQYEWLKGNIAGAYTVLNPLFVKIEGPVEMEWLREPYLEIGGEVQTAINNPTPVQQAMLTRMPVEIVTQIRNGERKIWLSPNICNITFGDKQDYELYPVPIAKHAFMALEMKAELYAMDRATIHSVKNRILLIKVGSDQFPVTDNAKLQQVSQIFSAMGRTGHFVWSHAIEMEWIEPSNTTLQDEKKYHHWNDEIRSVTGVNPIFTGTTEAATSIGNSIMNFKGVEMEVGEAQGAFSEMLAKEIKLLRTALSISADVDFSFDQLNMKDEVQFMSVLMQMVMNGLLDPETALETMGFHFPEVRQRMEKILKDRKKGLFTPTPSANNLGPDGKPLPQGGAQQGGGQSKPGGKGGTQTGGRPANQTGQKNKQKAGKSQPKKSVTLTLKAVGSEVFGIIDEELDAEQMEDTCTLMNTTADHILTTAQFEERFPNESIIQAWPELSAMEVMQASAAALKVMKDIESQYDKEITRWKAENKGDAKRGPYVTDDVKHNCMVVAKVEATFNYLKALTGLEAIPSELSEAWNKHYEASKASVGACVEGMAEEHLEAQAWTMCCARLKKTM